MEEVYAFDTKPANSPAFLFHSLVFMRSVSAFKKSFETAPFGFFLDDYF